MAIFNEPEYQSFNMKEYPDSFIYFLIKNDKVIYIGQTKRGLIRLFAHQSKRFNIARIIAVPEEDLDIKETEYILKYNPILNEILPSQGAYSLNRVKKIYISFFEEKINITQLTCLIKKHKIKILSFKGTDYIHALDLGYFLDLVKEDRDGKSV